MARTTVRTDCCIAGCGPAGAMLGLLLARRGLDVVVLEKHGDFLRDFRGDTIHPSTMEILDELGLVDEFLAMKPSRAPTLEVQTPGGIVRLADFRRLRTRYPFIAIIPQWDFLDLLTRHARRHPGFHLMMNTEARDLIVEDGAVVGVRHRSRPDGGEGEIGATLTVAADGRSSVLRDRAGLPMVRTAPPIDVLWFRLPRTTGQPDRTGGYVGGGRILVAINRTDYWQCGFVIPKGSAARVREAGLERLRRAIHAMAPELGDAPETLRSWDQVNLLTVQADRLRRWSRPGLLCIGDAAHAMSPVGGVGINFAVQDAVEAANVLAEPLRRGHVTMRELRRIQRRRAWQVRIMQALQARAGSAALLVSGGPRGRLGGLLRAIGGRILRLPAFRRLPSRVVGLGIRRVHVEGAASQRPAAAPAAASAPPAGAGPRGRT